MEKGEEGDFLTARTAGSGDGRSIPNSETSLQVLFSSPLPPPSTELAHRLDLFPLEEKSKENRLPADICGLS